MPVPNRISKTVAIMVSLRDITLDVVTQRKRFNYATGLQIASEAAHRNAYGCLDRIHYEGTLDGAQALDGSQYVDAELIVVLHVGGIDLQQIVEFSGNIVAFGHFGDVLHPGHKVVGDFLAHTPQFNAAEYNESLSQLGGIEYGGIPFYDAGRLHPVHAVEYRRGGKMDLLGELLDGDAAVFLEDFQDLEVGLV